MTPDTVPFRQLLTFLARLGFGTDTVRDRVRVCRHAASDTVFLFRDRAPDAAVRDYELLSVRKQLTERGLIAEDDFETAIGLTRHPANPAI